MKVLKAFDGNSSRKMLIKRILQGKESTHNERSFDCRPRRRSLKPAAKQKKVDMCMILLDPAGIFGHFGLLQTSKEHFDSNFVWGCAQTKEMAEF